MSKDEFLIVMKYNAEVIPEHISMTVKHYIGQKMPGREYFLSDELQYWIYDL